MSPCLTHLQMYMRGCKYILIVIVNTVSVDITILYANGQHNRNSVDIWKWAMSELVHKAIIHYRPKS
jgi:hypothetical protein